MSINDEKLNSQSNPPPVPDVWSPPIEGLPIGEPPPKPDEEVELPSADDDQEDAGN